MMRILIAEDDANLRRGIADLLTLEGFVAVTAADGTEALAVLDTSAIDLCVLDVMMPGLDGFAVCRAIRERNPQLPILFLTARGEEIDRVLGFECGADDYVPKPFGTRELLARIRALLRRSRTQPAPADRFSMADLIIDRLALRAFRHDVAIDLAPREVRLLEVLHTRADKAVSRDELFDLCWGRDYMPNSRSLDQYVSALRRKVEHDPAKPRIIRTVHGVGYRYDTA